MAVNPKYIGKKYPPSTYEVGREKVREYADAIGDMNPLCRSLEKARASKYGNIVAPPTFAVVYAKEPVGRMLLDPDLSLNLPMLVHGEQEFEFHNVVLAGDEITTEGEITEIYEKKGKDFVTCTTTSKNQRGELVCTGRWTFVVRG
ncbi:MAG: MaoC family dehydratase N-terminal domain-containing protein [bacterium]